MTKKEALQLFEQRKVRTIWDDQEEKWYFSIVDVCGVLTDSSNPGNYWKVLKHRLVREGIETVTKCNRLKLLADDLAHLIHSRKTVIKKENSPMSNMMKS